MTVKIALYVRVSREDLTNANQEKILKDYCERQGWNTYKLFSEVMSTRKTRPIKQEVMQRLRNGEFNILLFTRLDRFARSSIELQLDVEELVRIGVRVIIVQQGFDLDKKSLDAITKLQVQMQANFAEFERSLISERTIEALASRKAKGVVLGRPWGKKQNKKRNGKQ